ncbi:polycystin-2-like protein 2 [Calliphora vicina]|uniref:polycystin-2-like protein 2 n=1 Tax=Calliphora vicina TaxID=7373 RepID=UPI00325BD552
MFSPRSFIKKFKKAKNNTEQLKTPKKKITEKSPKYDNDENVKAALLEILIYVIFLVAITIVANAAQHLYMFYFNQTLERSFLDRNLETDLGTELSFNDLVTTADWWLYMERVFLANLHGLNYEWINEEKLNDNASVTEKVSEVKERGKRGIAKGQERDTESLSRIYLRDNILLGPPRLRQIRVRENSCEVHEVFLTYFINCYAGYSKDKENITDSYMNSKFFTRTELQVNVVHGQITKYYGAGYVQELSYDFEENRKILENLKANKWIDRGTRMIILEFVLFNINTNIFNNVKIIAEVPPVGGIVPSHQFQALKLHTLWTEGYWYVYVAGGIFYIMVLFYTIEEIIQYSRMGAKLYFSSVWNFLDILVLMLSYLSLIYNLLHPWYMSDILNQIKAKSYEFVSIDYICYWNLLYIDMMGICVFLVWIKIFKYISFNKTMLQFSTTLKRCAKDLFGFAVMFFIVFLAYAQLGLLIFGSSHPDFREFGVSVITLMRMFLGDFDYQLIEEANHVLGPIYFLTYVLFVFFILLNMFLAIINDTYGAVKSEVQIGRSDFGPYLKSLFQKFYMWCFPKRKLKTKANESLLLKEMEEISATTPSLYPASTNEHSSQPSSPDRVRKRVSEVLREYFEELSEFQEPPDFLGKKLDFESLNKRITMLEEVLEQLINHMDRILKKVESKKVK